VPATGLSQARHVQWYIHRVLIERLSSDSDRGHQQLHTSSSACGDKGSTAHSPGAWSLGTCKPCYCCTCTITVHALDTRYVPGRIVEVWQSIIMLFNQFVPSCSPPKIVANMVFPNRSIQNTSSIVLPRIVVWRLEPRWLTYAATPGLLYAMHSCLPWPSWRLAKGYHLESANTAKCLIQPPH